MKDLLPYQAEDVNRIINAFITKGKKGIYLGHDRGLGKTVISIALWEKLAPTKTLIVCNSSAKGVWESELEDALKGFKFKPVIQTLHKKIDKLNPAARIVIVSYDLAHVSAARLHLQKWALLICDEAHHLGSQRSRRSRYSLGNLYPIATKALLLSGSIYRNSPQQLWPTFRTLEPEKFGTAKSFMLKYCAMVKSNYGGGWKPVGFKNKQTEIELFKTAAKYFLIRRTKDDEEVKRQLPKKREQRINLELTEYFKDKKRQEALNDFRINEDTEVQSPQVSTAYKELGDAKAVEAARFIAEYWQESPEEKILVFCYHKSVYQKVRQTLTNRKPNDEQYDKIRVTGFTSSHSSHERKQIVGGFQAGYSDIFVATYAAAESITLTNANVVIMVELAWSRILNEQAIDRVDRYGQTKQVQVIYLTTKQGIDSIAYNNYQNKLREHRIMDQVIKDKQGELFL